MIIPMSIPIYLNPISTPSRIYPNSLKVNTMKRINNNASIN